MASLGFIALSLLTGVLVSLKLSKDEDISEKEKN